MDRPDVFVSYTRADERAAEVLEDELENRGLDVWRDRTGVRRNEDFAVEIVDAIFHSAAVVVLWSPASKDSPWVLDEALLGHSLNRLIGLFLETDVHKVLPPPYKTLDSQTFNLNLTPDERNKVLANLVTDVAEARTRTPLYMRQRPPPRKSRDEDLDAFTHSVLNAKFCFEAYDGDAERSIHTRFLAAVTELRGWAEQSVREAVSRFGDGNSPGEAIWALYAAADAINSKPLWIAVGRAVRPFSIMMSVACLKRGGMTGESIKSEFYPTQIAKLLKRRRKSVPRPKKRKPQATPSKPHTAPQASPPQSSAPAKVTTQPAAEAAVGLPPTKTVAPAPPASSVAAGQPVPPDQPQAAATRAAPSKAALSGNLAGEKKANRSARIIGGAAFLFLVVIAFIGWLLFGQRKEPPDAPPKNGPTETVAPNPQGPELPPTPVPESKTYTVQKEESCWAIAFRLTGDGNRCADLQPLNPTLDLQGYDSLIRPGDKLVIPTGGLWAHELGRAD